ncbi:uncharacterized protein MEPE_01527 [Melanopsichium pennsylvanicum]|uniref:Rhodanese domain-containing protein n=2 Tax=Melanopsichium pennsylvanicum TaxID=63383 RepID=A0AAJ4XIY2_9BASI|nr:conserved hypothetical protein [Melanopsichium pennsylvanicum 4]SNX82821.1 uncharacterized protein MEPE_01527 [Melanopsichium pennsylvanicum]
MFASNTVPSDLVGCHLNTAILQPYLTLEHPRLVLDVRLASAFHQAHLANSYHISPISQLKSRYSYLPPRNVPFLVLAEYDQYEQVVHAFSSSPSARLIFLSDTTQQVYDDGKPAHIVVSKSFFESAKQLGYLRSSQSHEQRIAICSQNTNNDDVPTLLFRPSNAVRTTVLLLETQSRSLDTLRVLDLGCGAARDLAWILHGSRSRTSSCTWTGVGIDNWKAVLTRAQQLMDDLFLNQIHKDVPRGPRCEKLLWAKCSDTGLLEPLVGTGKGKPIQPQDVAKLWSEFEEIGLRPLLSTNKAIETVDEEQKFDLILSIRFHPRALLPQVSRLVRVGGIVLLSHFVTLSEVERARAIEAHPEGIVNYDSPPHQGRIQPGEIEGLVEAFNLSIEQGFTWIIHSDVLELIEDGRIIRSVALRKVAL